MLKIKFNINEFTIIFRRRFEGKNECKRISFSLYQLQCPPLLFFSVFSALAPFSASTPPFCFSASFLFFSFLFFQFRRPLLLFSFFFFILAFLFQRLPFCSFSSPKIVTAQKAHSISPIRACLSIKMKSNRLPQDQEGPTFHANSQAKKKSSFSLHSSKTQYSLQLLRLFYLNKSSFSSNLQ